MKSIRCRCCNSSKLSLVHDFGLQPLAGRYPQVPERTVPVERYPLDLTQCLACGLLQVTNMPPIDQIFNEEYCYSSSTVPDLVQHFFSYSKYIGQRLPKAAKIFEFGANDGILLTQLREKGYECAGIDASDNVAAAQSELCCCLEISMPSSSLQMSL